MIVPARSLEEVTEQAIQILTREMGDADTMRFLSQFIRGSGDYTQEREELFKDLTLAEILAAVRGLRG